MKSVKLVLALSACGLLSSGCAAIQLNPGANMVLVTKTPVDKSCKFLGGVVGNQGGSFSGKWTSNKNLAEGSMNDIKNKAHALGANYVQLETDRAGQTTSGNWDNGSGSMSGGQTDVTLTGNAFFCPNSAN